MTKKACCGPDLVDGFGINFHGAFDQSVLFLQLGVEKENFLGVLFRYFGDALLEQVAGAF